MKRVLHIIDHLGLGGAQAVLLDLVTLMDKSQWPCEVAVMHGRGIFAEALEKKGIKVHTLSPSLWPPCYLAAFVKLQRDFDLLHFHLSGANWIAKPLAALAGDQPRIVHDHASADLQFRGLTSVCVDALMHRFSSHIIAVSPEVKEFLTHYEAVPSELVTVIPNGVNTEEFFPCSIQEKKAARDFFQLKEEDYIIGTVGRLASEKNQEMFLYAAHQAIEQGLKATFVLAGTGPEEFPLRALAKKLGIENSILFLGQVEERVQLYRALDLFTLTSRYEGLPMVLLEAMASGIPVVSTDLEGINHALEGEKYGALVSIDDVGKLSSIFLDRKKDTSKIKEARLRVESQFSAKQAAVSLGKLYQRLL